MSLATRRRGRNIVCLLMKDRRIQIVISRSRPAFSLIELVIVTMILGCLAGIAIPRVANSLSLRRVESAAKRIIRDLELAQQQAKASSASRAVAFDVASDSYELVGMRHLAGSTKPYLVYLSDEPYRATILSADFEGDTEIVFDGYGIPDSGGTIMVAVGGHQRDVTVDPDIHQVEVEAP